MKTGIVLLGLLALASAAPQSPTDSSTPIPIIKQDFTVNPDGSYSYYYETGNGIKAGEDGDLKPIGTEGPVIVVKGQYEYPSDDGTIIKVSYIADENGYQPTGDHIPTSPPIPEAIQRALQYIANAPPSSENP